MIIMQEKIFNLFLKGNKTIINIMVSYISYRGITANGDDRSKSLLNPIHHKASIQLCYPYQTYINIESPGSSNQRRQSVVVRATQVPLSQLLFESCE